MMPDWTPKGAQILSKSIKFKNKKKSDAVSERKMDPGGVRPFETRRLGIAFGSLKSEKGHPQNDPKINVQTTLKNDPK